MKMLSSAVAGLRRLASILSTSRTSVTATTLTERLVSVRQDYQLSQRKMSDHFGVSPAAWHNYESRGVPPKPSILTQLADEGFCINWLLTGEGDMRREVRS